MIMAVTAFVVTLSATSIQVTLSSPLFTSQDYPKTDVGLIAQRAFLLANIGLLPVYALWWFIEPVMRSLGQPDSLANGLTPLLRVLVLGQPGQWGQLSNDTGGKGLTSHLIWGRFRSDGGLQVVSASARFVEQPVSSVDVR